MNDKQREADLLRNDIDSLRDAARGNEAADLATLERLIKDREHMFDNLTQTQTRCSELIQRSRFQPPDDVAKAARAILSHSTKSYVEDAALLAKWILLYEKKE